MKKLILTIIIGMFLIVGVTAGILNIKDKEVDGAMKTNLKNLGYEKPKFKITKYSDRWETCLKNEAYEGFSCIDIPLSEKRFNETNGEIYIHTFTNEELNYFVSDFEDNILRVIYEAELERKSNQAVTTEEYELNLKVK